jgi:hypothetical protein
MQFCSIEEAWGDPLMAEKKKKKKAKKIYTSKIPNYIEDTSYLEGGHDNNCATTEDSNLSTKNKNKFDNSRNQKNNYRKKKSRAPKVQISYDNAAAEYRNFQMENSNIKQKQQPQPPNDYLVEGFESGDELNNIEELERSFNEINDVDETEYTNGDVQDTYSPSTNYATETEAETELESDVDEETDDETDEIVKETIKNSIKENKNKNNQLVNVNDIDYRLNNLNRNVNMLLKKMDDSDFFDDDSQDNIHDLILFILFGVFMIFVLDTIYRLGKRN